MSKKGNKGGARKAAEAATPVIAPVAALSPVQQLVKDVIVGAGAEGLPKDAKWPPSASEMTAACAAIETLLLKHITLTPKEPDHLQRLVLAMIMATQSSLGVTAPTARALIAPSFTLLWDELVKYPQEYGLGDASKSMLAVEEKELDLDKEKERDEHYRPPASSPAELEAWSRAFAFTKAAISTGSSKA